MSKSRVWLLHRFVQISLLLLAELSVAAPNDGCVQDCVEVGQWQVGFGLGLGYRSNPLEQGDSIPLIVLPELSYYGERFFLKNFKLGYTFFESTKHQFNLVAMPSYDQVFFNRWDPLNFDANLGGLSGSLLSSRQAAYTVNISGQTESGSPSSVGGDAMQAAGPNSIKVEGAGAIRINDYLIDLTSVEQRVEGVSGLAITVIITDGLVDIKGVQSGDDVSFERAGSAVDLTISNSAGDSKSPSESSVGRVATIRVEESSFEVEFNPAGLSDAFESDSAEPVTASRESLANIKKRRMAGMAGLEYMYSASRFMIHLQGLTDFTDVHGGHEARLSVIVPIEFEKSKMAATFGVNYQSRSVLDYYYGIHSEDVSGSDSSLLYSPKRSGVAQLFRLDWQRPVSKHWSWRAMLQYNKLSRQTYASPLIAESNVSSIFMGGVYHF